MSEARSNPVSRSNMPNQTQIPTQAPAPNSAQDQRQAQDEHLDAHAAVLINQFLSKTRRIVTSELGGDFRCTICSEGFLRGKHPEVPIRLNCGHVFGMSCILKWLSPLSRSGNNNCPNCRAKIFDDWDRDDFPVQESPASIRRATELLRSIHSNGLREGQSRRRFEEIDETQNPGRPETDVPAPHRSASTRRRGAPDPVETAIREREEARQRIEGLMQRMNGRIDVLEVGGTDGTPAQRLTIPNWMRRAPAPTETPVRQREDTMEQSEGRSDVGGVTQAEYDAVREEARNAFTPRPRVRLRPRAPRRLGEARARQSSADSRPIVTGLEGPTEGHSIEPGAARRPAEATTSTSSEVAPTDETRQQELFRRLNRSLEEARRVHARISAATNTPTPTEAAPVAIEEDNGVASMFTAAETEHDLQRQQEATNKRKHHMWMQFCEGVVRAIEQSTDSAALANHDLALTIINMADLDDFIAERARESPTWRRILQTFPRLHTEMVTRFNDFRPLTSVNIDHRIELERLLSSTHFHIPSVHKARWLTRLSERLARGAASSNHDAAVARLTERVAHLSSPFRESESIAWPEGNYHSAGEHLTSEEGRQMQRMEDYLLGRTPVGVRREGAASVGAALRVGAERSFAMTVVGRL